MTTIIPEKIDQEGKGLGRVISHLDKPNFNKLVKLFMERINQLEDISFELLEMLDVDQAFGYWLDIIGKIVGVTRQGDTDEEYRRRIKVQFSTNTATGTPNTIIETVDVAAAATYLVLREHYPAFFTLYVQTEQPIDNYIYSLVDSLKPAGVGFMITNSVGFQAFTPLVTRNTGVILDEPLLLDSGEDEEDYLLLDSGTDADDYLIVSTYVFEYLTNPNVAYLPSRSEIQSGDYITGNILSDDLLLDQGLVLDDYLLLDDGFDNTDNLRVEYYETTSDSTYLGVLANRITINTTK